MECWWYLVTILYVFAWTQASLLKECPPPEDSYPCYCEEDEDDEDRSIMHCNNLKESKQISTGLSRLTDYKISTVSIWFCDVEPTIKSDAFKGPVIDEITFSYSTVYVENPPFKGQENSLKKLTFLFCFDEEDFVNSWSLSHLNNLKEVSFEKNDIKVLKNDWITSAGPNLRTVTFDNCKLEELEDKVFAKLEGLTTLSLWTIKLVH